MSPARPDIGDILRFADTTAIARRWRLPPSNPSPADFSAALAPPPSGFLVGVLSYDLGRLFERLGPAPPDDLGMPLWMIAEAEKGSFYFSQTLEKQNDPFSETSRAEYEAWVRRAQEYIAAGDIYQVNLARRFRIPAPADPRAWYSGLCARNPAPYAAYLETPWGVVASASPELLVEADLSSGGSGRIRTRPIAGTYPRALAPAALPRDPKEQAEHIMLVDLERNDLGRVARPGTVRVAERLVVESYATVHHLVSEVRADAAPGVDAARIFGAVFPGGTITGCPKIRAMEIIDELEPVARGGYTGSAFLLDAGRLVANILIRTAFFPRGAREGFVYAGAGIVADSDPAREARECEAKAEGVF